MKLYFILLFFISNIVMAENLSQSEKFIDSINIEQSISSAKRQLKYSYAHNLKKYDISYIDKDLEFKYQKKAVSITDEYLNLNYIKKASIKEIDQLFSMDDLVEINKFLGSKVGKKFFSNQKKLHTTIDKIIMQQQAKVESEFSIIIRSLIEEGNLEPTGNIGYHPPLAPPTPKKKL